VNKCATGDFLVTHFNIKSGWWEGWGGEQKVIPRPSSDYFVVGRRQKVHIATAWSSSSKPPVTSLSIETKNELTACKSVTTCVTTTRLNIQSKVREYRTKNVSASAYTVHDFFFLLVKLN
jgi:hypothetical protein